MLQERTLFRGPIVEVTDVTCRVTSPRCSCEEHSPTHCIVIPRRGAYVRHIGKRQALADPTHALFFNSGETYRVSHPVGLGDDCTALVFDETTLLDLLEVVGCRPRSWQPFSAPQAMLSARTVLHGHQLFRRCASKTASSLAIEEMSLSLLEAIVTDAREVTRQARAMKVSRSRERELLEAVRVVILSNPGLDHTLKQLSQAIGSSPFHLTRVCRRVLGVPLHQYVLRVRLAVALERLRGGAASLSRLALDLGFSSHSHFTATFRRLYGVSPSSLTR